MTAFVEECRYEWKRLGVPDLLAEEMATELESDLAEAHADGVSATEMLGESDPRRFAATWASERGLVAEPAPPRKRRRRWIWIVVGLIVLLLVAWIVAVVGLFAAATVSVHKREPASTGPVAGDSELRRAEGLSRRADRARSGPSAVHKVLRGRCNAVVVSQRPVHGTLIPYRRQKRTKLTLRLRG